nr:PREDICTED: uncharacterized protein LOC109040166 isoform X1 [Bemisia tabaci]
MENVTVEPGKSGDVPPEPIAGSAGKPRRNNYGPGGRFGHRRSPTTGHRRRHLTPDPKRGGPNGGDESDVSSAESGRDPPPPAAAPGAPDKRQRRISSTSDDEAEHLHPKSKVKAKRSLSAVEAKKRTKRLIESESTTDEAPIAVPDSGSVLRRRHRSKSKETPEMQHPSESSQNTGDAWWKIWPRAKSAEPEAKTPSRPKRTRSASRGKSDRESTDDQRKPQAPTRSRQQSRPNSELYKDESSDDFWKPKGSMEKLHSNYTERQKGRTEPKMEEKGQQEDEPVSSKDSAQNGLREQIVEKKGEKKSKILETRKLGTAAKPRTAEKVEVTENDGSLLIKRKFNLKFWTSDSRREWRNFVADNAVEVRKIRALKNKCISDLVLMILFCGVGAIVFRSIEGAFENFYKCGVKRVKRDFIDNLWLRSHNLPEEEWKSLARHKLMDFEEQLHTAFEAGLSTYSGQRSWSFINAFIYCLTVITTIGYGHITPSTTTGKIITMVYAVFGIPMFLILLADFGKMFTRCIKFLWAFVRRLYYTGSCRKVRRNVPQEVMKGVQIVYSMTKKRRSSTVNGEIGEEAQTTALPQQLAFLQTRADNESPGTPALSTYAIDDEFNLPISVAITILLLYIICGASVFYYWEEWGFLESFYFVFISMSTIGFGDYVPKNQMYMMASIVYLVFGLALTSMCINVVQEKLSDSIRRASAKIGATIGFQEDLTLKTDDVTDGEAQIVEGKLTVKDDALYTENESSKL